MNLYHNKTYVGIFIAIILAGALFCFDIAGIAMISYRDDVQKAVYLLADNNQAYRLTSRGFQGSQPENIDVDISRKIDYRMADRLLFFMLLLSGIVNFLISVSYGRLFKRHHKFQYLLSIFFWAGLGTAFMLGALDLVYEIFGAEDSKHVYYFMLAAGSFIWILFNVPHKYVKLFFGCGLLIHADYLVSEICSARWYSKTEYLFTSMIVFLMHKPMQLHKDIFFSLLNFDLENAVGKNIITFFYMLSFIVMFLSFSNRGKDKI